MTFVDPNPDPPPLVEEIGVFRSSCCLNLTLQRERFRRKYREGLPKHEFQVYEGDDGLGVQSYAVMESQGYRPYMEDRHVRMNLCESSVFGLAVLDGHGIEGEGHLVAEFGKINLPKFLEDRLAGEEWDVAAHGKQLALKIDGAFTDLDLRIQSEYPAVGENNGATCVASFVDTGYVTFSNIGDSRGLLVTESYGLDFVTLDHKPNVPSEHHRVHIAGGYVDDFRVNGDLAVSRTLGDLAYKKNIQHRKKCPISNEPDITFVRRKSNHRCVVLATDGIWDALSSADIIAVIQKHDLFAQTIEAKYKQKLAAIYSEIMKIATGQRLSSDNITIVFILLGPPHKHVAHSEKVVTTV